MWIIPFIIVLLNLLFYSFYSHFMSRTLSAYEISYVWFYTYKYIYIYVYRITHSFSGVDFQSDVLYFFNIIFLKHFSYSFGRTSYKGDRKVHKPLYSDIKNWPILIRIYFLLFRMDLWYKGIIMLLKDLN